MGNELIVSKNPAAADYHGEYYVGEGATVDVECEILSTADANTLTIRKFEEDNLIYLNFTNIDAESVTIDAGITCVTYSFEDQENYEITIHSDCVLTVNGGSADGDYREILRDEAKLIPEHIGENPRRLHFNLWFTENFVLK